MLIQCTSCGTQAKIPDSKEGAKVKCPSCGHTYMARARGARGRARAEKEPDATKIVIGGVVVVGALFIGLFAMRSGDGNDPVVRASGNDGAAATPKDETPPVDMEAFDGPVQTFARSLHTAANAGNESRLRTLMVKDQAYAAWLAERPADAEPRPSWMELGEVERVQAMAEVLAPLMAPNGEGLVFGWSAYDGVYVEGYGKTHVVRLRVEPVGKDVVAGGDRWVEWTLLEQASGSFGWIDVDRYISEEEQNAAARASVKRPEKVTLSDGQTVSESEPRPIDYDADVPEPLRKEIDGLMTLVFDDENITRKERNVAEERLVQMQRNAIPPILTRLAAEAAKPESDDERQRNIFFIDKLLESITGSAGNTLAIGATEEQIKSGVKQWFAWYDKRYARFKGTPVAKEAEVFDALEGVIDVNTMSDRERREYEKAKREFERNQGDGR